MQLNCNSLHARKSELLKRLADQKPDVVLLQEARLLENEADPRFPGYNIAARRDTPNGRPLARTATPGTNTSAAQPNPGGRSAGAQGQLNWTCKRRGPAMLDSWCAGCKGRKKCTARGPPSPKPGCCTATGTPDSTARPRQRTPRRGKR